MPLPAVVGKEDSRHHISNGINTIADLLAVTLGPTTGYVAHIRPNGELEMPDDAAIVARRILGLQNSRDDIGAMMLRHVVWHVGNETGDGGATAAVLLQAIYSDALRLLTAGYHPTMLEKGIKQATEIVVDALYNIAQPITHENQLVALAQSVIREDDLAVIIGEMRYLLGADGNVIIRDYVGRVLSRRYIAGTHVAAKATSRHFLPSPDKQEMSMNKVALAISDIDLNTADDVVQLMHVALQKEADSLLIVCPQISDKALGILLANHRSEDVKLKIFAVQISEEGEHHQSTLHDLCLLTEAKLLGNMHEHSATKATVDDIGIVPRISYENEMLTLLIKNKISPHLETEISIVRRQLSNLQPDANEKRAFLIKRLSRLTGGVGELKLGGMTKHERKMRRHQAERALKALALAQEHGVVVGGGAAFIHARNALKHSRVHDPELQIGYDVVYRALATPMRQILANASHTAPSIVIEQLQQEDKSCTYDVLRGKMVNAFQAPLVDPVEVLVTCLQKASSMAIRALMTDAIVFHRNPQIEGTEP